MSAPASNQALRGAPGTAARLVVALAAGRHQGNQVGADVAGRASAMLDDVLNAAAVAGFVDGDVVLHLAAHRRYNGLLEQLAADVVAHIGGPDKFYALLDLSTTPNDWNGFTQ